MNDINTDIQTYVQLQRRLYEEARLLDQERYDDWLTLLCDDVNYQMRMRNASLLSLKMYVVQGSSPAV